MLARLKAKLAAFILPFFLSLNGLPQLKTYAPAKLLDVKYLKSNHHHVWENCEGRGVNFKK